MYLITSGEYVNQGLQAEFGKIPPAFLPLQNKRLFIHLLDKISSDSLVYISLPESFVLNKNDEIALSKRKVIIIRIPSRLSLGQSITHALNSIGKYDLELKIIHGDTLFENLNYSSNIYLIARTNDNYSWAYTNPEIQDNIVYAGFFSFSNQNILIRLLTNYNYDFIKAIEGYKSEIKVNELYTDFWYDFGHINTYYRSKSHLTSERSFNNILINDQTVQKESYKKDKILAEANWFSSIPAALKVYTPQIFNSGERDGKGFYEIEYFFLSTLSELFVFGFNNQFMWGKIFESCQQFIEMSYTLKPIKKIDLPNFNDFYAKKTYSRLNEFKNISNFDLKRPISLNGEEYPSLLQIVEITSGLIKPFKIDEACISHGDFCFSNILYDFRKQNIKVIDPRGLDFENNQLIYGDIRYDVAKLAHSVIGLYDHIIAGYYELVENEPYNYNFKIYTTPIIENIQNKFLETKFTGKSFEELDTFPILIHLFLSMLPLHADDENRQKALIMNALRLYKKYIK